MTDVSAKHAFQKLKMGSTPYFYILLIIGVGIFFQDFVTIG